jgi:hypothetical protein
MCFDEFFVAEVRKTGKKKTAVIFTVRM